MDKVLVATKPIEKCTSSGFVINLFSLMAKAIAVIAAAYGIYRFIIKWSYLTSEATTVIIAIIYQIFWLLIVILVFHIWWLKGEKLNSLKETEYPLTETIDCYLRAAGESLAMYMILLSTSSAIIGLIISDYQSASESTLKMITSLFSDQVIEVPFLLPYNWLPLNLVSPRFLVSLTEFVNGLLVGILVLGLFYLFAESFKIGLENVRNLRKKWQGR